MTVYDFNFKKPFANGANSSEIQPFPDENRGLGIAFVQTDGKPEMKGLNGLFNKITKALLSVRQNGLLGWVNDIEYIQGGFVVEGRKLYQAKVNNTNRKPSESQSDWELWTNASNISVDANGNILKNTDIEGAFTLKVNDATTTVKGVARFATTTEVANKSNVSASVTPSNAAAIAQSTDFCVNQSPVDVTSSRSSGVTYQNNSPKGITVYISVRDSGSSSPFMAYINGFLVANLTDLSGGSNGWQLITLIVPAYSSYQANSFNNPITRWVEVL